MRIAFARLILASSWASVALARPTEDADLYPILKSRALTPDNTCGNLFNGNNNNYTCNPQSPYGGPCCSQYGYCGSTDGYCGTGCQPDFAMATTNALPVSAAPSLVGAEILPIIAVEAASPVSVTVVQPLAVRGMAHVVLPLATNDGYCGTAKEYCTDPDCQWRFGTCDSSQTPAGASTLDDPRPLLGQVTYDDDIYACTKANVVALTYDDGPYWSTNQLLDVLKSYGFKATFFMTGNNLHKGSIDTTEPWPTIIKRMVDEGHQVASHTWSHYNLTNIPSDMRQQQMVKNERAIANIIGKYPTYMRPPYSQCSRESGCWADMKALGYHRVYFDLDTQDYLNPDSIQKSKDIVQRILGTGGAPDYLSIQHDIVNQSVAILSPYYFDLIKAKGWKGVTAGECLEDAPANWYRTPRG
ncbi:MAG: hypothetical protein Q9188_000041 [Gyalolechia gomerana]